MLITFSGVVGSGKSTAAQYTLDILRRSGLRAEYIRFQSLTPSKRSRRRYGLRRARPTTRPTPEAHRRPVRGTGYRRHKLTLSRALGYLARAMIFRAFQTQRDSQICLVVNRYFYDNLAHYQLTTRIEQVYISLLRFVMPVPELPVVLVASDEAIVARRPNYERAYLAETRAGYENLRQFFPELIVMSSCGRTGMEEGIARALSARLALNL